MRRPLCAFLPECAGCVSVVLHFCRMMGLFAAVCGNFCCLLPRLVWWRGGAARGLCGLSVVWAQVLGVGIMKMTGARLAKIQDAYAGERCDPHAPKWRAQAALTTAGRVSSRANGGKSGRGSCPLPGWSAPVCPNVRPEAASGAAFRWMCRMQPSVWTTTPTALSSARNICPGYFVLGPARASAPGRLGSRRR